MKIDEYRIASAGDIPALVQLINAAYRPESALAGWTHESEFIGGSRINHQQLSELLVNPGSTILLGLSGGEILACVNINEEGGAAYIAMLTVKPKYQNEGFGKEMLQLAEEFAENQLDADETNLFVISERTELIEFYLRRGYRPTGVLSDYPATAGVGTPRVDNLKLELFTKQIC